MRGVGILLATVLAFAGCAAMEPIRNVSNAPIILPAGKTVTLNEVSKAIVLAGTRLGWQIQPEGPGHLMARLVLRTHVAVVDIEHDTKSYSIKYRDSMNLDAKEGMIHRSYNSWVQSLDKSIRSELGG